MFCFAIGVISLTLHHLACWPYVHGSMTSPENSQSVGAFPYNHIYYVTGDEYTTKFD